MLSDLPLELQSYVLTFVPARALVKTLGCANRHFHNLVEAHVRRDVQRILCVGPYRSDAANGVALEFEAQRPIDTVTAKHTLHFSHFVGPGQQKATSESLDAPSAHGSAKIPATSHAVFSFSLTDLAEVATKKAAPPGSQGSWPDSRRFRGNAFQPYLPTLHPDDMHRLNQNVSTSSVDVRDRMQPTLDRNQRDDPGNPLDLDRIEEAQPEQGQSATQPPATSDEPPFPFLRPFRQPAVPPSNGVDGAAWSARRRFTTTRAANEAVNAQSLEMPLDAYDWQGSDDRSPGTSLAAMPPLEESVRFRQPACYAFQLDPLDSFESLILTLNARKCIPDLASAYMYGSSAAPPAWDRSLRYQRTVAEGLDRVFRDWFQPSAPNTTAAASNTSLAPSTSSSSSRSPQSEEMFSSMSALVSSFGSVGRFLPLHASLHLPPPAPRNLEFDSTSCTLTIQPHATLSPSHPAHSSASHHYLSQPSLSAQYATLNHHDRVELTFHCDHVTINSARLLSSLELLERDVQVAEDRARSAAKLFPTLLAGSGPMGAEARWSHDAIWSLAANGLLPYGAIRSNAGTGMAVVVAAATTGTE